MFARVFTVLSLAAAAIAAPAASCNSGALQCCNSLQQSSSADLAEIFGGVDFIPAVLQGHDVPFGVTCTPLNLLGGFGGNSCQQQTACCEDNSFNGLFALGCSPIGNPIA